METTNINEAVLSPVVNQVHPEVHPIGVGGFDLMASSDRGFALDFNSTGKLDHIVFYRPGNGTIWIIDNEHGCFMHVLNVGDPGSGIAGYPLDREDDRALAFDFDSSGHLDHIMLYNPTIGRLRFLKKDGATLKSVYSQDNSIGDDKIEILPGAQVFALDYTRSGFLNHLVVYYPGTGIAKFFKSPK